jgi:hypothetical protein
MTELRFKKDSWDFTGALCREIDNAYYYFFPERGSNVSIAKKICSMCSIRLTCLDYAVRNTSITHGVWGGMTARDIARIRNTLGIEAFNPEEEDEDYGEEVG